MNKNKIIRFNILSKIYFYAIMKKKGITDYLYIYYLFYLFIVKMAFDNSNFAITSMKKMKEAQD